MARQTTWADLSEHMTSEAEAEDMLKWAGIMANGIFGQGAPSTGIKSPFTSSERHRSEDHNAGKRKDMTSKWVKKRPLPTAPGKDDGAAAAIFAALEPSLPPSSLLRRGQAPRNQDVWHADQNLQEGAEASPPRRIGLQPDALLCVGSAAGCAQYSGWLLDLEVQSYICAVMQPDSYLRWGRLSVWQRDLQHRSADRHFPCPFWHALLFDLDLGLHIEVEAFARVLLAGEWSMAVMKPWQRRLRNLTRRLWFPQRLWYDLIHRLNLRADEPRIRLALGRLLHEHASAHRSKNMR